MALRGRYEVRFSDGRAILNLDEIWKALYDQHRTALYCSVAKLQKVDTGFAGPSVETFDIDFAGAAATAAGKADTDYAGLLQKIDGKNFTIESLRAHFKACLGSAEASRVALQRMMADNAAKNAKALASHEKMSGWGLTTLKLLRDGSATLLGLAGAVASGGTAVAFIAVGSGLSAAGKVQDSKASMKWQDEMGKGVAIAVTEFTFGLITMGIGSGLKAAGKSGKVVDAIVSVTVDTISGTATGLVISEPDENGKAPTLGEAAAGAFGSAVVSASLSQLVRKDSAIDKKIRHYLLPATTSLAKAGDKDVAELAVKAATKAGKNLVKDAGKKGLSALLGKGGGQTDVTGKMVCAPFFGGADVLNRRVDLMITKLPGS